MFKKYLVFSAILIFLLNGCSFLSKNKKEEVGETPKIKRKSVNVRERTLSDETGGFVFGDKNVDPLGKQNVMWRAALKTLDFMPLQSVNYDGGSIITDWYSANNLDESIKINILFHSNEVRVSSVEVKSFKKSCSNQNACKIISIGDKFNNKIKEQIFEEVKRISIDKKKRK